MNLQRDGDAVRVESNGKSLLLDWYLSPALFRGDTGNFSHADKLAFVSTHQQPLSQSFENYRELFSIGIEQDQEHFLSSYSSRKLDFIDSGGSYEREDMFYVSEWFLLFAMQTFRHYLEQQLKDRKLVYATYKTWLPTTAAFAAFVGRNSDRRCCTVAPFGKGVVLKAAQNL